MKKNEQLFGLRLYKPLHNIIKERAHANRVSMNSYIVNALMAYLVNEKRMVDNKLVID